jgi:glycosyltransferase involved in cell wall biosynthesis
VKLCFIGDARSVHTQRWVRWFADRHEVILIPTFPDEALAEFSVGRLPNRSTPRGFRLLSSVSAARRLLAAHRPDLVHAHFINEAGWLAAAARWRPFLVTTWGSDLYRAPSESRLARHLNPWALRAADWVTCDSMDQARLVRSWGVSPERVSVIGWGVDRREFHPDIDGRPIRNRLGIPHDASVVLSPRQWRPNSNIETIVEAHAQLPGDVHLVLKRIPRFEPAGEAQRIETAIAASPARGRIRVVGEVAAGDLPALYSVADVAVSLCATDGTPVSVLEVMALGCPVVAFENASLSEWVAEPGGKLVPTLGAEPVAGALLAFLASPQARARAAAHNPALIAARADRAAEMTRMDVIYARLAGARGSDGGRRVA